MKRWLNSWTEVEELGRDAQGRMRYAASISVGHRVFRDKSDGQWKKRKLTDSRPGPVVIQGAKCCVEVYPWYAKYFDVDHEEVRVEEERWVVQYWRDPPGTWRDVGAWNPVMEVEETEGTIKVTVTYETDYGPFVLEYLQRDGAALKHNLNFTNTSGSTETFRVLQRWAGITGDRVKVNQREHEVTDTVVDQGTVFTFGNDAQPFKVRENTQGLTRGFRKDILKMLTGTREPQQLLIEQGDMKFEVQGFIVTLTVGGRVVMSTTTEELSLMIKAVEDCPQGARVFTAGLGLGVVLYALAISDKAAEIVVCEINNNVINQVWPPVSAWLQGHCDANVSLVAGDVFTEVTLHGKFDWIFMDIDTPNVDELKTISLPFLTEGGVYTSYDEVSRDSIVPYLQPVEVSVTAGGLKTDFVYSKWVLLADESIIIDPATATLDNPTEDGQVILEAGPAYTRDNVAASARIGVMAGRDEIWDYDARAYVEWDISALAGGTLSVNPFFRYEMDVSGSPARDAEMNPLTEEQPSDGGCTDAELWGYMATGVAYVNPFDDVAGQNKSVDMGANARTDLQAAIDALQSWFAIGLQSPADEGLDGTWSSFLATEEKPGTPDPTLYVEYPGPPVASVSVPPLKTLIMADVI